MKDGRKLEGKVLAAGEKVRLKMKFGVAVLKRDDILRMDREVDRGQEYREKAAELSDDDADGHYELGLWCKANGLRDEARREFVAAVAADAEHANARAELGFTRRGSKWVKETQLLRSAQALHKLGNLAMCIKILTPLSNSRDEENVKKPASLFLAEVYDGQREWADAAALYQSVEKMDLSDEERTVVQARREVLAAHPDGMYVVSAETAARMQPGEAAPAGMRSLSDSKVMQAALIDKAQMHLDAGKTAYERARRVDVVSPEEALELYDKAEVIFDQANCLSPDIARSFKIEIARKRIASQGRKAEMVLAKFANAPQPRVSVYRSGKFTREGKKAWVKHLNRLEGYLKKAEREHQKMLGYAQPYPDELAETIAGIKTVDAQIKKLRGVLRQRRSMQGVGR